MPMLTNGSSITLSLTDNDSVTIITQGVAILTAVSGLGIVAGKIGEISGARTLGPYAAGVLTIQATVADCRYEASDGPSTPATLASASAYKSPISQYERALIFPQHRQSSAVKGFSRNINDAQFVGAITDADVYDTEPGALSVGMLSTKALAFPWGKMLWDLNAGESLFIQMRVKTIAATTASNVLCGNNSPSLTWEGFNLQLYGPTHATTPGRLFFNFKGNGTAVQAIELTPVTVAPGSVVRQVLATDTYMNISILVDGATKRVDAMVNCQPGIYNSSVASNFLNGGTTIPAVKRNFAIGYSPTDDGFTATGATAARFQALRVAVLPADMRLINFGLLDWQFNINPFRLFSDLDYVGVI